MERLLEVFQNMVLKLVERVLMPVLPLFIANFCVLSYEGAITKAVALSFIRPVDCHHLPLHLVDLTVCSRIDLLGKIAGAY